MITFEHLRLRANPAYAAMAWNRVSENDTRELARDADSFGLLMPRDGQDLPVLAIDCDTALLFFSLSESGPPPDFVFSLGADQATRTLQRLVFDSILEVEHEGRFVSGTAAYAAFDAPTGGGFGQATQLTRDALRYAAALRDVPASLLAHKLYGYNRRPKTRELRRRLPDDQACLAFLGLAADGRQGPLDRHWSRNGRDADSPWLVFTPRQPPRRRADRMCKLYVGLAFEELPECLPELAREFARADALQFKIGAELDGLLRPDKLVAYFPSQEALLAVVPVLMPLVEGRVSHPVPFTAEIVSGGALSWGIDPAENWLGNRLSWRQWICEKLAGALIAARRDAVDGVAPWEFALARLRQEGIEPETFMPVGAWTGAS